MFNLFARGYSLVIMAVFNQKPPKELEIQLRVVGKKADEFFDLSRTLRPNQIGEVEFMHFEELNAKWLQLDGSLVVEFQIVSKSYKFCDTPRRDVLLAKAFEDESFVDFELVCEGKQIKIAKELSAHSRNSFEDFSTRT